MYGNAWMSIQAEVFCRSKALMENLCLDGAEIKFIKKDAVKNLQITSQKSASYLHNILLLPWKSLITTERELYKKTETQHNKAIFSSSHDYKQQRQPLDPVCTQSLLRNRLWKDYNSKIPAVWQPTDSFQTWDLGFTQPVLEPPPRA
ncbi:hypothetical protein AAY473_025674 [Plecturocebus cupreus]